MNIRANTVLFIKCLMALGFLGCLESPAAFADPELLTCEGRNSIDTFIFVGIVDKRWGRVSDFIVTKIPDAGGKGIAYHFPADTLELSSLINNGRKIETKGYGPPLLAISIHGRGGGSSVWLNAGDPFLFNAVRFSEPTLRTECTQLPVTEALAEQLKACFARGTAECRYSL